MKIEPQLLSGNCIRLEPLSVDEHLIGLQEAGSDSQIFRWFADNYSSPEMMVEYIEDGLADQQEGAAIPYAIIHIESGKPIGATRFCSISPKNRRVEIRWTWITPSHQRTAANSEAAFLMLRHAFEEWDYIRVEFETAARNQKARNALRRIGATEEGVLRKHMLIHQELQNSVYYSIIDTEWMSVKEKLRSMLAGSDKEGEL